MKNCIKSGIIVVTCILPMSLLAQGQTFEKMLMNKASSRGFDVLYAWEKEFTFNGKIFKWNQSLAYPEDANNSALPIFKNLGYKFYAGGDSAETSEVVKGMQELGGLYHKYNRSVPEGQGTDEELAFIMTGPKQNATVPAVYGKHPVLNKNQNIEGSFNLLGRKVADEMLKEKHGIEMSKGVYLNNKQCVK